MIHKDNAERMNCRMMVEGANSPTTPAADSILNDKGVTIVPDVMANAGGVVVSYFEWVQNLQHFRWTEDQVNERLGEIMRRAFQEVADRAKKTALRFGPPPTSWASSELSRRRPPADTSSTSVQFYRQLSSDPNRYPGRVSECRETEYDGMEGSVELAARDAAELHQAGGRRGGRLPAATFYRI